LNKATPKETRRAGLISREVRHQNGSLIDVRAKGKGRTGRLPVISDEKVEEIAKWMTGHFDRRTLPLQEIARIHGIKASNNTILSAFARHGYHHHLPDCKPFLSEATKRKRWTFSTVNWDRPKEYWRCCLQHCPWDP
jgi:hypothetical protein